MSPIVSTPSDDCVTAYAVTQSSDGVETIGDIKDAAPYGIVVAQDDEDLTDAVQAAVQKLIDDGTLEEIFAAWGSEDVVVDEA